MSDLLDELDEAERVMRECGEKFDDVTAMYCRREAEHDGDHQGYLVITWPRAAAARDSAGEAT